MKKIMIYLLAAALACGLVVSLGYAQAPQALENAPPFVNPPPPAPPLITGCWHIVAIINLPTPSPPFGTGNVAYEGDDVFYVKLETQEGIMSSGTLYIKPATKYAIYGFVNGVNVSAFTYSTKANGTFEHIRYITATLTEESVMYGISIVSNPYPVNTSAIYLNQIAPFRGTRIADADCPNY